jgi:HD-like signal output (HDOD) protein
MTQHATEQSIESESTTRTRLRGLFKELVESCDLPPFPAVAARAMSLAQQADANAEDLVKVVSADVALAARVLRISKSTAYMRPQPPKTLHDAIMTVGFRTLRTILVAAAARSVFGANDWTAERLWEHGLATAFAADELAALAGESHGGSSFIAGLFHDVGHLVFHLSNPEAFANLVDFDEEMEAELFRAAHSTIGGCLADNWELEHEVVSAVLVHHRPRAGHVLAERVATADWIAHQIGAGSVMTEEVRTYADGVDLDVVAERVQQAFAAEKSLFD